MHKTVNNLLNIQNQLKLQCQNISSAKIIAVSKTFPISEILSLIQFGHLDYGENKIQEAIEKWTLIKKEFNQIQLHMLGKIQTNKVKYLIPLFDYIHSLDNQKLAEKISHEQEKKNIKPKIFIQVNLGQESQKSGIDKIQVESFYNDCINRLGLDIVGLMCIPPQFSDPNPFFLELKKIAKVLGLKELSMGMSSDFIKAANHGSTFLRIGTDIFGERG